MVLALNTTIDDTLNLVGVGCKLYFTSIILIYEF